MVCYDPGQQSAYCQPGKFNQALVLKAFYCNKTIIGSIALSICYVSLSTELSNLREIMGTSEFVVSWSEVRVDLETPKSAPEVRAVLWRMVPLALSLIGLLQHMYKKKNRGGTRTARGFKT